MTHFVFLPRRAERDLRGLGLPDLRRIRSALEALARDDATDVKALARRPWLRLRAGDYRLLYRPLTTDELAKLGRKEPAGCLVARVVHRSELERAVRGL